jgi:hypothetical protein
MMDSVFSPFFDPAVESKLCTILMVISLVMMLWIVFLALIIIRIDGMIQCPWSVIWIPAWLLDAILLVLVGTVPHHDKLNAYKIVLWGIYVLLFVLVQVGVVLRLDDRISWPVVQLFIPYFVIEGIQWIVTCVETVRRCRALIEIDERRKMPLVIMQQFLPNAIRSSMMVLIALRIDEIIQCSWGIVFIPMYVVGLSKAVSLICKYTYFSKLTSQPDVAQQGRLTVIVSCIAFGLVGVLMYALIGLVARRLDGINSVTMSYVVLPLFIIFVSSIVV